MGLGLGDFLDLTPFEWFGIKNRYIEASSQAYKERWEMTRWHAWRTVCPPTSKPGGISVLDFIRFPWEAKNETVKPVKDIERFKAVKEIFKD